MQRLDPPRRSAGCRQWPILENGEVKPLDVKVGDIVIFDDGYGVKSEKIDDEKWGISESDILAMLNVILARH
ncbi:hypothetical protein ACLK19_28010 [Escherichia coli]